MLRNWVYYAYMYFSTDDYFRSTTPFNNTSNTKVLFIYRKGWGHLYPFHICRMFDQEQQCIPRDKVQTCLGFRKVISIHLWIMPKVREKKCFLHFFPWYSGHQKFPPCTMNITLEIKIRKPKIVWGNMGEFKVDSWWKNRHAQYAKIFGHVSKNINVSMISSRLDPVRFLIRNISLI